MKDLRVYDRISEAVGWTPMVRLGRALPDTACEVYAKLEFLNPMGSTKDRIARHFIEQAMSPASYRQEAPWLKPPRETPRWGSP